VFRAEGLRGGKIAAALGYFNKRLPVDVILLVRGGGLAGKILWSFQRGRSVARANCGINNSSKFQASAMKPILPIADFCCRHARFQRLRRRA